MAITEGQRARLMAERESVSAIYRGGEVAPTPRGAVVVVATAVRRAGLDGVASREEVLRCLENVQGLAGIPWVDEKRG